MGSFCRSLLCHPFKIFTILILAVGLSACGSDGKDGAQGPRGEPGPQGPPGEAAFDPASVDPITPVLDLSGTVSVGANGTVTIHYFLTDGDGNGIDVFEEGTGYTMRVYVSEQIPDTTGDNGGRAMWEQRFQESGTPTEGDLPGTLTLLDAATGEYTYVCATQLAASPDDHVYRATVRTRWRENIDGENVYFAYPANGSNDFRQSGTAVTPADGAKPVSNEACASCHGQFALADPTIGHGGGYSQETTCVHCHNLDYQVTEGHGDAQADLPFMIHRIHNAGVFDPPFTDHSGNEVDFSEITYPQEINNCAKCHSGPDADVDLEATPGAELSAYTVPTIATCGSCHADTYFGPLPVPAGMTAHSGGNPRDDSQCSTCHFPGAIVAGEDLDIAHSHNPDPAPENVSEYDVQINMAPPANGEYYVAGEAPVVNVRVKNPVTGLEEDPNGTPLDYENQGPDETTDDGRLHAASLYVYGPRSNSVPVLTTDSTTDGGIQQAHSLFAFDENSNPNPDNRVLTGANPNISGFRYQLQSIPNDLPEGTYMVRFEGEDYGTPGSPSVPEYWTASTNLITFQVGTAEEQHKVSGDACVNCHGDTIMHLEGAHPHHAPFDTDYCLACHDLSDNYGDYIGNRVHAVHNASITGDLHASVGSRDWSEVTYPQQPNNCRNCHTDPDAQPPVWRDPNEVACGGCHGADPDANPAAYPDDEEDQVFSEAAAANHMKAMGGTFVAGTTNPYSPTYVVRSCIVCHGAGGVADPYVTHQLKNFPPPEDNL
jgi:hypothetical protein